MSSNLKICVVLLSLNALQHLQAERNRIFQGQKLRHNIHNYLVKLKLVGQYETGAYCSGSILNSRWVITAAHCITPDLVKIYVEIDIRGNMKVIAKVDARKILWHPRYDFDTVFFNETRAFDVALLKTRKSMEFNKYVQPIRLATKTPKVGQLATIVGYGQSENFDIGGKEGAVVLTECSSIYEGLLCTETSVSPGDGDSGGALVSGGRLVGVTSASCTYMHESKPCLTLYVNIAKNVKWIKKVIES